MKISETRQLILPLHDAESGAVFQGYTHLDWRILVPARFVFLQRHPHSSRTVLRSRGKHTARKVQCTFRDIVNVLRNCYSRIDITEVNL